MFIFETTSQKVQVKLAKLPSHWPEITDRPTGYIKIVDAEDLLQYKYYFQITTQSPLPPGTTVDVKGLLDNFSDRFVATLETETGLSLYSAGYAIAEFSLQTPVDNRTRFIDGVRYERLSERASKNDFNLQKVKKEELFFSVYGCLFRATDIYQHPDFYEFSGVYGVSLLATIERMRAGATDEAVAEFIVDKVASMLPSVIDASAGVGYFKGDSSYSQWTWLC